MPWIANVYVTKQPINSHPVPTLLCIDIQWHMLFPLLNVKCRPHNGTIVHVWYPCEKWSRIPCPSL